MTNDELAKALQDAYAAAGKTKWVIHSGKGRFRIYHREPGIGRSFIAMTRIRAAARLRSFLPNTEISGTSPEGPRNQQSKP